MKELDKRLLKFIIQWFKNTKGGYIDVDYDGYAIIDGRYELDILSEKLAKQFIHKEIEKLREEVVQILDKNKEQIQGGGNGRRIIEMTKDQINNNFNKYENNLKN